MYIDQMIQKIQELETLLSLMGHRLEDYVELSWQLACWKQEVEWRQDKEYITNIAKHKADMYEEEISNSFYIGK